jgi:hypothetical protein
MELNTAVQFAIGDVSVISSYAQAQSALVPWATPNWSLLDENNGDNMRTLESHFDIDEHFEIYVNQKNFQGDSPILVKNNVVRIKTCALPNFYPRDLSYSEDAGGNV